MKSKYCGMENGCMFCDFLLCPGLGGAAGGTGQSNSTRERAPETVHREQGILLFLPESRVVRMVQGKQVAQVPGQTPGG